MLSYIIHMYHNKAPNYHLTLSLVFVHCFFLLCTACRWPLCPELPDAPVTCFLVTTSETTICVNIVHCAEVTLVHPGVTIPRRERPPVGLSLPHRDARPRLVPQFWEMSRLGGGRGKTGLLPRDGPPRRRPKPTWRHVNNKPHVNSE